MILGIGFIQYFILSVIVGGIIFKTSFQLKQHLIFSWIGCLTVYIVRNIFILMVLPIGISTLINLIATIFIFKYVFNTETWKKSIISTTLIYLIMTINEILTLQKTLDFLNTDIQTVLNNTTLHIKATMIQNIGLLAILILTYFVRKYLIDRRAIQIVD